MFNFFLHVHIVCAEYEGVSYQEDMAAHHDTHFSTDMVDKVHHIRSRGRGSSQHQELRPAGK